MTTVGDLSSVRIILCEDVRHETGGKYTLVGVMAADGLTVRDIPGAIPVAFFITAMPHRSGLHDLHLRIKPPGDQSGATMRAGIQVTEAERPIAVATPRLDVVLEAVGQLTLEVSADGQTWDQVININISHAPELVVP